MGDLEAQTKPMQRHVGWRTSDSRKKLTQLRSHSSVWNYFAESSLMLFAWIPFALKLSVYFKCLICVSSLSTVLSSQQTAGIASKTVI